MYEIYIRDQMLREAWHNTKSANMPPQATVNQRAMTARITNCSSSVSALPSATGQMPPSERLVTMPYAPPPPPPAEQLFASNVLPGINRGLNTSATSPLPVAGTPSDRLRSALMSFINEDVHSFGVRITCDKIECTSHFIVRMQTSRQTNGSSIDHKQQLLFMIDPQATQASVFVYFDKASSTDTPFDAALYEKYNALKTFSVTPRHALRGLVLQFMTSAADNFGIYPNIPLTMPLKEVAGPGVSP